MRSSNSNAVQFSVSLNLFENWTVTEENGKNETVNTFNGNLSAVKHGSVKYVKIYTLNRLPSLKLLQLRLFKKKIRNCVWATDPLTSELSSLAPRGVGRGRESVNLTLLWHVLENKTASWCIKAHSLPLVNCVTSPVWKAVLPTAMLLLMTT